MECLRLRIKDIDFGYNRITVRDAKGLRDRVTLLPQRLQRPLRGQIARVEELHRQDIARGGGRVYLPFALERKYPNAARELTWQYLFPAAKPSLDPRSGETRRHHVSEKNLQNAVKLAVRAAGIRKAASCHTFAGGRLRYSHRSRATGPQECRHHDDLHPRPQPSRPPHSQSS
jgi:integrase